MNIRQSRGKSLKNNLIAHRTSIAQPRSRSEDDVAQKQDIQFPRCCLPFSGTTYFNSVKLFLFLGLLIIKYSFALIFKLSITLEDTAFLSYMDNRVIVVVKYEFK